jgi:hypothetical protein
LLFVFIYTYVFIDEEAVKKKKMVYESS